MLKIKNTATTAKTTTRRKTEKGKVRFLTSVAIIFRTNTTNVIFIKTEKRYWQLLVMKHKIQTERL